MRSVDLDDYDVGAVLGVGTVGTIYAATERESGRSFAIKKLHPQVSPDPLIRARFRREMAVMERLDHHNIIRVFGRGEDDGQLFYVMELVEGGTVKDLLRTDGRLQWPEVVEVAGQVCSALQHAHNHGVIHRDLKPGNLFLTTSADVKLGDFGIARDLKNTDITAAGMTVGTHAYMAPEQITGDDSVSGKADLYSLGCCLFEMLVGRTPFVGANSVQLLEQHLRVESPRVREFVSNCPPELDEVIHKLLAKDPDDRPFNARNVQAVMLRLGETRLPDATDRPITAEAVDTTEAEHNAATTGREMLQKRIRDRSAGAADSEISWGRLAVMFAAIAGVIAIAALLKS